MTVKELMTFIGKVGTVRADGLLVEVTVKDVKMAYGSTRYLVAPVAGSGTKWTTDVKLLDCQETQA